MVVQDTLFIYHPRSRAMPGRFILGGGGREAPEGAFAPPLPRQKRAETNLNILLLPVMENQNRLPQTCQSSLTALFSPRLASQGPSVHPTVTEAKLHINDILYES